MRALGVVALLAALALAGCATPASEVADAPLASAGSRPPPVVVAVIDTGINPYHLNFRGGPGFASVPGFPADALVLDLAFDAEDYERALEADAEEWSRVGPGALVRFPGTRLAGISLGKDPVSARLVLEGSYPPSAHYLLDDRGHGTAVADSVLAAAPDAHVLMVQVEDDERIADAMLWIAQQPWIDIVSVSAATWVEEYAQGEASMGLPPAYKAAHDAGKLIFNGAGNEPVPHFSGEHSGPSFVVAVGGAQNATRGETRIAARFPDIVSDFEQERAMPHTLDETDDVGGTSFSTPYAAGAAAQALWLARAAGASPTADALRAAVEAVALAWGPTDWRPRLEPREILLSNPVLVPAAQMGWGYFGPELSQAAADVLLGAEAPAKARETV
ncbi:MAG TPA: S8/S53 family peptidase, partial [Candidatus Thermoplasmatota archaeon]|nr:S8/S53 family peptidase [Candidatus Thermoplasmatota archaeon]